MIIEESGKVVNACYWRNQGLCKVGFHISGKRAFMPVSP